ncbi:hypothetical protein T265_07267 [Opisthorchis viverrini]|uniref:Uncharacterized protein n=1 Tax=Opisthorchis viverrini TaxID=6198 RepID=A0A074ZD75_OPIVI|nr:hypothetical protein T265_07267 [Opisthorchis viverrini]KER25226.1 hypothetical protein T265_07267 [Opisthorchis viverrini]
MSPRMVTKRLQINCHARRTDQQPRDQLPTDAPELPIFQHITSFLLIWSGCGTHIRINPPTLFPANGFTHLSTMRKFGTQMCAANTSHEINLSRIDLSQNLERFVNNWRHSQVNTIVLNDRGCLLNSPTTNPWDRQSIAERVEAIG